MSLALGTNSAKNALNLNMIPMTKTLTLLLWLTLSHVFSQTDSDYAIWSKIITDNKDAYENLPSIILIEQYKDKYPQDFGLVEEFSKEDNAISDNGMHYLALYSDSIFQKRMREDRELKTLISGLTGNFENHPKIDAKRLRIGNMAVTTITSGKYHSFFKKNKSVRDGWEQLQSKYRTNFVMEFSRIQYHQNLACLYYAVHCGGLCGAGVFIILEQKDGQWQTLQEFELWVS